MNKKMNSLPNEYHNQIFNRDVMEVLRKLPSGCLDMIYGDPDYNVGINYNGQKFNRSWEDYIDWYGQLSEECMRVLHPEGNLFLINYPRQNAWLRVKKLESLAFGVHDYAWVYNTNIGHSNRHFTTAHRSILHATKSKHNSFYKEQVAQPYKNQHDKRILARIKNGHSGRMPYSWFYFDLVKNVSQEKTFHACQIPIKLFEMLMHSSTKVGDKVFVLFGGSGSEVVTAKHGQRIFTSCEIHPKYYRLIVSRLYEENVLSAIKSSGDRSIASKTNQQIPIGLDLLP